MLYAVVERCPVHRGRLRSFDASEALAVPGVRDVVEVEPIVIGGQLYGAVRSGVAVIAEDTWSAMQGRNALRVTWDEGEHGEESSESIRSRFQERSRHTGETILRDEGNMLSALESAARTVEAEYELPVLAHACMEPMNFTADVGEDRAAVWGPTQTPRFLQAVLAFGLQLPRESVEVHPTLSGGGFGRRLAFDYGVEAAMISRTVGAPLKVVWTREDDVRHDYYRTPSYHRMCAGLDDGGDVVSWYHHVLTASLARNSEITAADEEQAHPGIYDVQGAADIPYDIDSVRIEYTPVDVGLQMGSWRSVAHSFNVFAVNCFVDELAAAAGIDPLDLHLRLLGEPRTAEITLPLPGRRGRPRPDTGSLRRVLELAADRAGWPTPLPAGRGRGVACSYFKKTYAAHIAEVSVDAGGSVRVHRIVAALDCGRVVNPSGFEAQAEGAAVDGVASVFNWEVTLERAPTVEVHTVHSDRPPSGIGEPPYPSVAPAVANAIFAASGVRIRRLPIKPGDLGR
jgi:isoquinoline 1-oxidoreductase beta subunit